MEKRPQHREGICEMRVRSRAVRPLIAALLLVAALLAGCGGPVEESAPESGAEVTMPPVESQPEAEPQESTKELVLEFLELVKAGRTEESQALLDEPYQYDEDVYMDGDMFEAYLTHYGYELGSETLGDGENFVEIHLTRPDIWGRGKEGEGGKKKGGRGGRGSIYHYSYHFVLNLIMIISLEMYII